MDTRAVWASPVGANAAPRRSLRHHGTCAPAAVAPLADAEPGVIHDLLNLHRVDHRRVSQVLLQRLPSFLVLSFPMATLLATLLAYGRLSANSELTALRSVGVTASRMIIPALVLSLLMTSLTFLFNDVLVPRSNRSAEVTLRSCLLYTSPSPRDKRQSRMPSSA